MKFSKRVELAEQFNKWAEKNCLSTVPLGVISFLDIKDLLMEKPVIRCWECNAWDTEKQNGRGGCFCWCSDNFTSRMDYCSFGARKD